MEATLVKSLHSLLDQVWGPAIRTVPNAKNIFLTFDDGPDPKTTPQVLDLLKKLKVRATFFVIAERAEAHPALIKRILSEGHAVGNHSTDHRYRNYFKSVKETKVWISQSESRLQALIHGKTVGFRPPAGVRTPAIHKALVELDIPMIYWSQRFYDTRFVFDEDKARKAASKVKQGDIILLHDSQSLKTLGPFLEGLSTYVFSLQEGGFTFATLAK